MKSEKKERINRSFGMIKKGPDENNYWLQIF